MGTFQHRRGISPVISEIMLTAAVLTVGGGVWYYSISYCTVTTDSYIDETIELMSVAIERYAVEQVFPDFDTNELNVWVNNYGEVDITVDVYIDSNNRTGFVGGVQIPKGEVINIPIDFSDDPFELYEVFQIKIYSRRQNVAYYSYTVG